MEIGGGEYAELIPPLPENTEEHTLAVAVHDGTINTLTSP